MELVGWTNDRLVADHSDRLPQSEWAEPIGISHLFGCGIVQQSRST
jgi:hypothetical protein